MKQATIAFFLIFLALTPEASSSPQCHVSVEKRALILNLLCGHFAEESEFRKNGPGCVERSIRERSRASAALVVLYSMCNDENLSDRIQKANELTFGFIEKISICTNEPINATGIFKDSLASLRAKTGSKACSPDIQEMAKRQREHFATIVSATENGTAEQLLLRKMKVFMRSDSSVYESLD